MSEITLTDQNFEAEVLKEENMPILVDFWATWCGPCQMQGPIIEKLAEEMTGKAKVGKIDVDQSPNMAEKFGVKSIPTLMIFKKGEIVWQSTGLQTQDKLMVELNKHI
ncbi:MAG: thioredoxin [Patescibacteria group bacterium]